MKLSKEKCGVLHLGGNKPKQQHRLGDGYLSNSSAGKDLQVLLVGKLNVSQQCAFAAVKVNHRQRSQNHLG